MQSTANKMVSAVCLCLAIILLTAMPVSAQAPTIESASEISSASNSPFADVLLDTVEPEQYGKLEITFNLDAVYDNTFDPDALSKFADAASIAGYALDFSN
ncbi:hypothetical protein SAMN05216378_4168 [Paenibacillus catalpae]|uniref:Uncharacterized protein n=1 Tax=Paenibacillus catalpae TaxID=1045775 RepID=A0A1I2DM32_9BACL|nr:hypothetical protein [Paenibacillus catalpae]SFE81527.1 hypothetical protein SAMN05216378_4168 [Paenibacillus catalpae]